MNKSYDFRIDENLWRQLPPFVRLFFHQFLAIADSQVGMEELQYRRLKLAIEYLGEAKVMFNSQRSPIVAELSYCGRIVAQLTEYYADLEPPEVNTYLTEAPLPSNREAALEQFHCAVRMLLGFVLPSSSFLYEKDGTFVENLDRTYNEVESWMRLNVHTIYGTMKALFGEDRFTTGVEYGSIVSGPALTPRAASIMGDEHYLKISSRIEHRAASLVHLMEKYNASFNARRGHLIIAGTVIDIQPLLLGHAGILTESLISSLPDYSNGERSSDPISLERSPQSLIEMAYIHADINHYAFDSYKYFIKKQMFEEWQRNVQQP